MGIEARCVYFEGVYEAERIPRRSVGSLNLNANRVLIQEYRLLLLWSTMSKDVIDNQIRLAFPKVLLAQLPVV